MTRLANDDTASTMSDTETLVERPSPPSPLQKSSHSTRAANLFRELQQGLYSQLEYTDLTFSIMVMCNNLRGPLVVSINESFGVLLDDIQRMFSSHLSATKPKELRVSWSSGARDFGSGFSLNGGNVVAMMRLLKQRGGVDMLVAK